MITKVFSSFLAINIIRNIVNDATGHSSPNSTEFSQQVKKKFGEGFVDCVSHVEKSFQTGRLTISNDGDSLHDMQKRK